MYEKVFLAGVGAAATAVESASDIVNKLVEKGEITFEQGKVLNEELKRDAKQKAKSICLTPLKSYPPKIGKNLRRNWMKLKEQQPPKKRMKHKQIPNKS